MKSVISRSGDHKRIEISVIRPIALKFSRASINPALWVAADGSIIKESRRFVGTDMVPMYDPAGASTSKSHTQNTSSPSASQS